MQAAGMQGQMADDQLTFDVAPAPGDRAYSCCGLPCGALDEPRDVPRPHAPDCPNPNVGPWVHRETGFIVRRLHCISRDGTCPTGGVCPPRPGVFDPYDGACCITLRQSNVPS